MAIHFQNSRINIHITYLIVWLHIWFLQNFGEYRTLLAALGVLCHCVLKLWNMSLRGFTVFSRTVRPFKWLYVMKHWIQKNKLFVETFFGYRKEAGSSRICDTWSATAGCYCPEMWLMFDQLCSHTADSAGRNGKWMINILRFSCVTIIIKKLEVVERCKETWNSKCFVCCLRLLFIHRFINAV